MDLNELTLAFKKIDKDSVIGSVADAGNGYIVYLTRKGIPKGSFVTDNEYFYDTKDDSIRPFRVTDDPKTYSRAMRHIVYMHPSLRNSE